MAVMHKFSVSDINKLGYDIDTSPMVFKKIKNWIIKMPTSFMEPEKDNKYVTARVNSTFYDHFFPKEPIRARAVSE